MITGFNLVIKTLIIQTGFNLFIFDHLTNEFNRSKTNLRGGEVLLTQTNTNQTTLNIIPIFLINNILLQPKRKIRNSVHPKPFIFRNLRTNYLVGNKQCKNSEEHETQYNKESRKKVSIESLIDTAERADYSEDGDDEDEDGTKEERILQHFEAVGMAEMDVGETAHSGEGK